MGSLPRPPAFLCGADLAAASDLGCASSEIARELNGGMPGTDSPGANGFATARLGRPSTHKVDEHPILHGKSETLWRVPRSNSEHALIEPQGIGRSGARSESCKSACSSSRSAVLISLGRHRA